MLWKGGCYQRCFLVCVCVCVSNTLQPNAGYSDVTNTSATSSSSRKNKQNNVSVAIRLGGRRTALLAAPTHKTSPRF